MAFYRAAPQFNDVRLLETLNTITDAATITVDASLANAHTVTIAATGRTLNVTNAQIGRPFTVYVTQDGTGSRTITTYMAGYTVKWAGGSAPTLTTAAGKTDRLMFHPISATIMLADSTLNY